MAIGSVEEKDRSINILLVEDNHGDALLFTKAFDKLSLPTNITVADDGEKGMAVLAKEGEFEQSPMPDFIFLDINLPRLNGIKVLESIKKSKEHQHIPVIMFTSSKDKTDVVSSYELGANAYIAKPTDLTQLLDVAQSIENFWFRCNILSDSGDL